MGNAIFIFTRITPITIRPNPITDQKLRDWLKAKYDTRAKVKIPNPLQVAYIIAIGIKFTTIDKK